MRGVFVLLALVGCAVCAADGTGDSDVRSKPGPADALRENLLKIGASGKFVYSWSTAQGDWRPKGPTEFHEKTGDDPLLTFYEFSSIVGTWRPPAFLARFRPLAREQIKREFRAHRTIPFVTWHMENPYAKEGIPCGQAWYYRKKIAGYPQEHANVPREILEGTGSVCGTRSGKGPSGHAFANPRAWFDWMLGQGIAFCRELKDDEGRQIPIAFRFFHEPDGGGFWWGYEDTTPEDLIRLHRYAVDRVRRGLGAGNVLFCYGPDRYWGEAGEPGRLGTYLAGYPGDDFIDILGFDDYGFCHGRTPEEVEKNCARTLAHLRIVSEQARMRGKSCGIFESSAENTTNFYSRLHAVANRPGVSVAIMTTYDGQWTFPKSTEGMRDMVETLRRKDVLTAKNGLDLTVKDFSD